MRLRDIRFFDGDRAVTPQPLPAMLGLQHGVIGQRLARRLADRGFDTGPVTHVCVLLTSRLRPGQSAPAARPSGDAQVAHVEVGVETAKLATLPADVRHDAFVGLAALALGAWGQQSVLAEVCRELVSTRDATEFVRLEKDTKKLRVTLTFRMLAPPERSPVFVECEDKVTGRRGKRQILDLQFWDDLLPLASSMSVKGDEVTLKPASSFRATLYNERYEVPVRVSIRSVLDAS